FADAILFDELLGGDEFLLGFALGFGGDLDGEDALVGAFALGFGGELLSLRSGTFAFLFGDGDLAATLGNFDRLFLQNVSRFLLTKLGNQGDALGDFRLLDRQRAFDLRRFDRLIAFDVALRDGFVLLELVLGN